MSEVKLSSLKYALQIAIYEASKHKNDEDGGTCNFDTPTLILSSEWKESDGQRVFRSVGLRPYKVAKNVYHVFDVAEGQGFRRTAMAEAFRDCMVQLGYVSHVHYQMD